MKSSNKLGIELSYNEMKSIVGGDSTPTCNGKSCYVVGTNKWECATGGGYLAHCVETTKDNCQNTSCMPSPEVHE